AGSGRMFGQRHLMQVHLRLIDTANAGRGTEVAPRGFPTSRGSIRWRTSCMSDTNGNGGGDGAGGTGGRGELPGTRRAVAVAGPLRAAPVSALLLTLLTGVAFPMALAALAWPLFPRQAGGSLVVRDGVVIGSDLIGQDFTGSGYFHPRPSAAGRGYDATSSGG